MGAGIVPLKSTAVIVKPVHGDLTLQEIALGSPGFRAGRVLGI